MTIQAPTPPDAIRTAGPSAQVLDYLRVFWARKWLVLSVALLGCGLAYAWTERQPRVYEADCSLEYDPNPPRPLGNDVQDVANPMIWWETREYFATQNRIISSRAVAERVVRKLALDRNADFWDIPPDERKDWKGESTAETAQLLQSMVSVNQERDTRIVHVLVQDHSAERAMLIANSIADAYIEKTMEDRLSTTTGALEWLGKQLDSLKQQLEHSELALHQFTEEHSKLSISLEDQQNIVAGNIQQLSQVLTQTKTRRIELAARLAELKAQNGEDPLAVHATSILTNSAVSSMRDRYRALLTERDALIVDYGDQHPKMLAVQSQIETIKQQIRAEVDGLIASAQSDLHEIEQVQKGVELTLDQANRVGLELNLQEITHRRLQRERDNTAKLYGTLLERTAQTDLTRALSVAYVRVVDRALLPLHPVSPRVALSLAAGTLLGLMLGTALAFMLEQLDRTVRTVEDADALGVTVLGVMPSIDKTSPQSAPIYGRKRRRNAPEQLTNRDLVVHTHPKSSVAECCRTIRTNLMFMSADTARKTLVVTSASPREGKTTVTLSLAISLAQSGKRVLIVDTDLRKPRIHRALGKTLSKGVTTILVGEHSIKEALQETEIPNLTFLASGPIPPNPSELLHTSQFRELVAELERMYDLVIFDSPPLTAVTDAAIIAPQVDGAILVIHSQQTTRDALRSALRQLRDVGCRITGAILNDVDLTAQGYGHGSNYYYHSEGYYEAEQRPSDSEPKRPVAQA